MKLTILFPLFFLMIFGLGCNLLNKANDANSNNSAPKPTASPEPKAADPSAAGETDATKSENLLSLASGAYLVKQPENYGHFDHNPINLIFDGMLWRSVEGKLTDQVFVIETPSETTLKRVGFDTNHIFYTLEENAKDILFEASNTSADSGFQTILETSLAKEAEIVSFPVKAEIPARWFRLTVKNNHGAASATALKRIFGYGTQKAQDVPQNLSGTYRQIDKETGKPEEGDYKDLFIKQEGTSVTGCWREKGSFSGGLQGTVANLDWQQPDLGKNSGLMVFTQNKRLVFWRLKDDRFWALEEFEQVNSTVGECSAIPNFKGKDNAGSEIADELEKDGRTAIYGINFDFNSDKLRDESKVVLNQIVAVLKDKSAWKMTIEGHTDNIGGETFNQSLSEKRANAVKKFLTDAGIEETRLSAKGVGLSAPVASNETDAGRARNRRVELVKQ